MKLNILNKELIPLQHQDTDSPLLQQLPPGTESILQQPIRGKKMITLQHFPIKESRGY